MGDWFKKYTHLVNQAPAPTTPTRGLAPPPGKTPYSELRRRIAGLEGELQRQGVQHRKETADLNDANGGLRGQLDRRNPDRGDDSELTKSREESAKWKRKYEESITRLQRAEEEKNEAEHKAYNLEVDVEEKGAELAKLQKSKERLLKDLKSKEEEIEAQKKWIHENQPSEAAQKLEEERDEAVSAAQQLQEELLTYHSTHAKPRQNELATPKRTVDELENEPLCDLDQYDTTSARRRPPCRRWTSATRLETNLYVPAERHGVIPVLQGGTPPATERLKD
jgi:chromosome segregation ATPase